MAGSSAERRDRTRLDRSDVDEPLDPEAIAGQDAVVQRRGCPVVAGVHRPDEQRRPRTIGRVALDLPPPASMLPATPVQVGILGKQVEVEAAAGAVGDEVPAVASPPRPRQRVRDEAGDPRPVAEAGRNDRRPPR